SQGRSQPSQSGEGSGLDGELERVERRTRAGEELRFVVPGAEWAGEWSRGQRGVDFGKLLEHVRDQARLRPGPTGCGDPLEKQITGSGADRMHSHQLWSSPRSS